MILNLQNHLRIQQLKNSRKRIKDLELMVERPKKLSGRDMYPQYRINMRRSTVLNKTSVRLDTIQSNLSCLPTASNIRLLALLYHFLIIYCPIFFSSLPIYETTHSLTPGWSDDRNGSKELIYVLLNRGIQFMIGSCCYK